MNGLIVIPLVLIAAIPLAIILHRLSGRGQSGKRSTRRFRRAKRRKKRSHKGWELYEEQRGSR